MKEEMAVREGEGKEEKEEKEEGDRGQHGGRRDGRELSETHRKAF